MTRNDAIANLKMIMIAYVEPPKTAEQIKLINDTFDMAIKALEQQLTPKTDVLDEVRAEILNFKEKCNASDYLGCGILEIIDKYAESEE